MIHGLKDQADTEEPNIKNSIKVKKTILPKSTFHDGSFQPEESIVNLETAVDLLGDLCEVSLLAFFY